MNDSVFIIHNLSSYLTIYRLQPPLQVPGGTMSVTDNNIITMPNITNYSKYV